MKSQLANVSAGSVTTILEAMAWDSARYVEVGYSDTWGDAIEKQNAEATLTRSTGEWREEDWISEE